MKYAVVIPVKNEEEFIEKTLKSLVSQTILPKVCLLLDDHSTDNSATIIKKYAENYNFIKYHLYEGQRKNDRYSLGGHVVSLLLYGKEVLDKMQIDYDYLVKLDGDIAFDENFIETIWNIIKDQNWGIVSGTPYYMFNNKKIYDIGPNWHSRGQFKIYDRTCFEQIAGPPTSLGWDCADNIKAMEAGWKTGTFKETEYYMNRIIGGKFSASKGRINHGIGAYLLGYDPLYFTLRVIKNIFRPPYLIGSYYLLYGFFKAKFSKATRILTPEQAKILRSLQWQGLRNKMLKK